MSYQYRDGRKRPHPNPEPVAAREPEKMLFDFEEKLKHWLDANNDTATTLQRSHMWGAINALHLARKDWDFTE